MRNRVQRGSAATRAIVRRGRTEAGVADQHAGGLVIAMVVHRRRGENELRPGFAQNLGYTAAGGVVIEHREVAHFDAKTARSDDGRGGAGFSPADGSDVVRATVFRSAVAGRHGRDGDVM